MQYYEVLVASQRYHGNGPLTYGATEQLSPGTVVAVPLQQQVVLGVIQQAVPAPSFKTKMVQRIISTRPMPTQLVTLSTWLREYYPAPLGSIMQLALPNTLLQTSRGTQTPVDINQPIPLPPLTSEQAVALHTLVSSPARSALLHGNTGSGKTRLYLELAKRTIAEGKSCMVLTPEIGLTPQLVQQFEAAFPGQTVTVHSTLTAAQRRNTWHRINNSTTPLIIIGPRSALFSPVHSLGYIIIDEAHDTAYKQEQAPYYQATRVAGTLAGLHDAKVVLGSATPLAADYFAFISKSLPIVRMTQPAVRSSANPTLTHLVSLRERQLFSQSEWLSTTLIEAMQRALNEGTQCLLFLNRRGTARIVLCQSCGWQAECPNCDLPLTYHADNHVLRCHTCGHTQKPLTICPDCGSSDIVFKSIGTKAIAMEVARLFPKARVARFDSDNTKADSVEQQYALVHSGAVDILIGTQLLSKGLDLPRLSMVGVVMADTSLSFPDYTADERTYQMINQVIGRVGRGHVAGTVVLQTYHPDNPVLQHAIRNDYAAFYAQQIKEREQFMFPPFCYILKIEIVRKQRAAAQRNAEAIYQKLVSAGLALLISQPMPAFTERASNEYRWQIIVKAKQRPLLLRAIALLPPQCTYDIDPSHLL